MGSTAGILNGLLLVLLFAQLLQAADDIYSNGPFNVELFNVPRLTFPAQSPTCKQSSTGPSPAGQGRPPRDLFIAVPTTSGTYPVIQLQHGYVLDTSFYGQLLEHVASHGYIIVAPQMNQVLPNVNPEIALAAAVVDWHQNNLAATIQYRLPSATIVPNLDQFVLLGHSRGGKVAFGLAKGVCKTSVKYSAVVGFDPVDGVGPGRQTPPPILTNKPGGLNLPFPTLVVGAGLGPESIPGFPPCGPLGVSHDAFFLDSIALAFHFVVPDHGHMDYLDDPGRICPSCRLCKNGPRRAPMRQFSGGILVAFLKAVLFQDYASISNALANPSEAPVRLNVPQITGVLPNNSKPLGSYSHLLHTAS